MFVIKNWQDLSEAARELLLKRPLLENKTKDAVETIISVVRAKGDDALRHYTETFDGIWLPSLKVPTEKIAAAKADKKTLQALQKAIKTITTYHKAMLPKTKSVQTAKGVLLTRTYRSIEKVGLYVPGGNNTPLVSSLLMQAIPALVAGCPIRVLCTPPNALGEIDEKILVAARLCGIETIYTVGGAQAIAALAYGTETIPKVNKIFGPGNSYVTEAKAFVAKDPNGAAIDLPAGPSELMIIADDTANPAFIASDLIAQAEHGFDSQVFLVCTSFAFAEKVNTAVSAQLENLSRQKIIRQSLANSAIFISNKRSDTLSIINNYAPEHLIINCTDGASYVDEILNAGTIFLGPFASETLGDYVSGSNHVLPTNGFARNHSSLSTIDFLKGITIQQIDYEGIESLGETAYTLAMIEGLDGHANAIRQRMMFGDKK